MYVLSDLQQNTESHRLIESQHWCDNKSCSSSHESLGERESGDETELDDGVQQSPSEEEYDNGVERSLPHKEQDEEVQQSLCEEESGGKVSNLSTDDDSCIKPGADRNPLPLDHGHCY